SSLHPSLPAASTGTACHRLMLWDVLVPKFVDSQTRLCYREWLLAEIAVESEVDKLDNKRWSAWRDVPRLVPSLSLPGLVDSSPPPPHTCPDVAAPTLDR